MRMVVALLLAFVGIVPCWSDQTNDRTPYDMLIQSRRKDAVKEPPSTPAISPILAQAQLRRTRVGNGDYISYFDLQIATTTTVKPSHVCQTPADVPREPVYFIFRTGEREVTGITYRSIRRPNDVKLFLDTDGDGSWSDEVEYRGFWQRWFALERTYLFSPISIQPAGTDKVIFHAQCAGGKRVVFYPVFYRRGQVTLKGTPYEVALVDTDFDGRYDKSFVPPARSSRYPGCDTLIVDTNRNLGFDFSTSGASEFLPLSRFVELDGTYYSLDVAADGSTIDFREAHPEYGALDLGGADVNMTLYSDVARQYLRGASDKWRLPAGRYSVVELEFGSKDAQGRQWRFTRGRGGSGQLSDFEIRPGQTTSFQMGPSFQIRTSMKKSSKGDVLVDFEIEGLAGESYQPGGTRDGKQAPIPTFEIFDNAGKVVHSGRFEYG